MPQATVFTLGMGLMAASASFAPAQAGYYCSPGFAASYGGRCVAVASAYEVELYLNDPPAEPGRLPIRHHHRRHHLVTERY